MSKPPVYCVCSSLFLVVEFLVAILSGVGPNRGQQRRCLGWQQQFLVGQQAPTAPLPLRMLVVAAREEGSGRQPGAGSCGVCYRRAHIEMPRHWHRILPEREPLQAWRRCQCERHLLATGARVAGTATGRTGAAPAMAQAAVPVEPPAARRGTRGGTDGGAARTGARSGVAHSTAGANARPHRTSTSGSD